MIVDTEKLKTFSGYAKMKDISIATVYLWARVGKIKVVQVDKIKLVALNEEELCQDGLK